MRKIRGLRGILDVDTVDAADTVFSQTHEIFMRNLGLYF